MKKQAVDIAEGHCPHCGELVDAATPLGDTPMPKPGDVSICAYCTGYGFFNADLSMRKMSDEEFIELDLSLRSLLSDTRKYLQTRWKP